MQIKKYKKPAIFALLTIMLMVIFVFAIKYFKKATQASKISIGDITPDYSAFNNLKLSNIINGVTLPIKVGIRNFSPEQFSLSQIKIDIYSKENSLIAEQTNPMTSPTAITPNGQTFVNLNYKITSLNFIQLLKENGIIPDSFQVADLLTSWEKIQNLVSSMKLNLKGFFEAEGLKINIDQVV